MMDTVTVKEYVGDIAVLGTDKDVVCIFHKGTRLNETKSREHGTPYYDSMDFMKVIHPGEPLNVYDQPVREQDKWRFKAQWDRYQAGASQEASGTPLSVLFPWQPELVQTLGGMHITTVEQLANLSDTGKQQLMFGMNLSERAQKYLSTAEKGRDYHQMQASIDTQKKQIDELTATINELRHKADKPVPQSDDIAQLRAMIADMQFNMIPNPPPAKRGWPKGKPRKPVVDDTEAA